MTTYTVYDPKADRLHRIRLDPVDANRAVLYASDEGDDVSTLKEA